VIAADDFFLDLFTTALQPDEIITEIRLPKLTPHTGTAYTKLANRASHYAVAGCAAIVSHGPDGACTAASVVITGSSVKATRATAVEAALIGQPLDENAIVAASAHAADGLELVEDIHGSREYRAEMSKVMVKRALLKAAARA
jgi:carbon-monoxide dehydrogenase medium subunit